MKNATVKKALKIFICLAIVGIFVGISAIAGMFDSIKEMFSEESHITPANLVMVVIMVAGVLAIRYIIDMVLAFVSPKTHRGRTMLSISLSIIKYVTAIIILCWGLALLGVNVSTIVASVGIIALIVGFGAESLIEDVVTGVFMIFENQYNVGDIVEVNGFRGVVSSITIRTTCITDAAGNIKIINNSDMKNILNRSDKSSKAVANIAIPYATDLLKLESEIPALTKKMFEAHMDLFKSEPEYLGVQELADSAVVLRFIAEVHESDIFKAPRVLNHDLLLGFRELGVECPFPQVDVHSK